MMQRGIIELGKSEDQPWIYLGHQDTQQITKSPLEDIFLFTNQQGTKLLKLIKLGLSEFVLICIPLVKLLHN